MSYANKGVDSKDAAALRREYEQKAAKVADQKPGSMERLQAMDAKRKAFERVADQIKAERKENMAQVHRALKAQGLLK